MLMILLNKNNMEIPKLILTLLFTLNVLLFISVTLLCNSIYTILLLFNLDTTNGNNNSCNVNNDDVVQKKLYKVI
jgi:hypothetical protein